MRYAGMRYAGILYRRMRVSKGFNFFQLLSAISARNKSSCAKEFVNFGLMLKALNLKTIYKSCHNSPSGTQRNLSEQPSPTGGGGGTERRIFLMAAQAKGHKPGFDYDGFGGTHSSAVSKKAHRQLGAQEVRQWPF